MLKIVMDSAGEIPDEWQSEFDVAVIPINIQFGNQTYQQGIDLSNDDFYHLADSTGIIPKTSQPTPQQFVEFYKRIAQAGDTILSLHVTSKLSGTFNSAVLAAQELHNKLNVIPFDSGVGICSGRVHVQRSPPTRSGRSYYSGNPVEAGYNSTKCKYCPHP